MFDDILELDTFDENSEENEYREHDLLNSSFDDYEEFDESDDLMKANLPSGWNENYGKQGHENGIHPPQSKEITADAYNNIIGKLQKSFKEGSEIMNALKGVKVVEYDENEDIMNQIVENNDDIMDNDTDDEYDL